MVINFFKSKLFKIERFNFFDFTLFLVNGYNEL